MQGIFNAIIPHLGPKVCADGDIIIVWTDNGKILMDDLASYVLEHISLSRFQPDAVKQHRTVQAGHEADSHHRTSSQIVSVYPQLWLSLPCEVQFPELVP